MRGGRRAEGGVGGGMLEPGVEKRTLTESGKDGVTLGSQARGQLSAT